jgi:hypothetical protein
MQGKRFLRQLSHFRRCDCVPGITLAIYRHFTTHAVFREDLNSESIREQAI